MFSLVTFLSSPFPSRRSLSLALAPLAPSVTHTPARPPPAPAHRGMRSRRAGPPAPGPGGDTALLGLEGWTVAGREGREAEGSAAFCLSQTLGRTHGAGSRWQRPGAGCGRRQRRRQQQQGLLSRLYVPVIVCLGHLRRGSPPPYTW